MTVRISVVTSLVVAMFAICARGQQAPPCPQYRLAGARCSEHNTDCVPAASAWLPFGASAWFETQSCQGVGECAPCCMRIDFRFDPGPPPSGGVVDDANTWIRPGNGTKKLSYGTGGAGWVWLPWEESCTGLSTRATCFSGHVEFVGPQGQRGFVHLCTELVCALCPRSPED